MTRTSNNSILLNTLNEKIILSKNCFFSPLLSLCFDEINAQFGIAKFENDYLTSINEYDFNNANIPSDAVTKKVSNAKQKVSVSLKLLKNLPFKKPYILNESPLVFNKSELCSFSPDKKDVELLHYNNDNDFSIILSPKDKSQQIIMVKTEFQADTTFHNLYDSLVRSNEELSHNDQIEIPIIDVDILTEYEEITNRQASFDSNPINLDSIKENICFRLNNQGAIIKSEIEISGKYNCVFKEPKKLLFDDSFVVFLKQEKSKLPYFAGFFNDTRFLKEHSKSFISKANEIVLNSIT